MKVPAPSPLALRLHAAACEAGEGGYLDPSTGLFVMTSYALRRQAGCCGSGCRHCPWPEAERARAGRPPAPAWPYPPSE
ncbi:MAG: hypothetical protein KDD82_04555 [Planctomycetes bacterium]|nr:hypothetical protein [Planctomycetota bacterium]